MSVRSVLAVLVLLVAAALSRQAGAYPASAFVGGKADHLVDETGALDLQAIRAASPGALFTGSNGSMASRGVAKSAGAAFWLRLRIIELSGAPAGAWVLSFNETRARHATLFVQRPDGETRKYYWNRLPGRETEPEPIRFPIFTLKADELSGSTIYLRIETPSSMRANLWLQPTISFTDGYSRDNLMFGLLIGLIFAVAVYLAAIGIAVQSAALGWLSGISIAYVAYVVGDQSFIDTMIGARGFLLSSMLSFPSIFFLYACALAFVRSYLRIDEHYPRIARIIGVLVVLNFILAAVAIYDVVTPARTLRPVSSQIGLLNLGTLIFLMAATLLRDWRRACVFALCFLPAVSGGLVRLLPDTTGIETAPSVLYFNYYGIALSLVAFAVLTSIDIGARQQRARQALQTSELRLRDYASAANDWFWETDTDGRLNFISPAMAAVVDRQPRAEFSDRWAALQSALAGRQAFRRLQLIVENTGKRMVLELSGKPILDPAGAFVGFRGTANDVTAAQEQAEAQAQQQKMAAIGQLAGGVAHEINNLLHPILNLTRHAYNAPEATAAMRKHLGMVMDSARRAGDIVVQILGTARSARKSTTARLGVALESAIEAVMPLVPKETAFTVQLLSRDGPVIPESDAFQVVSNLVLNAAHAGTAAASIELAYRYRPAEKLYELSVRDDGKGMDEDTLRRASEPFFTTKPAGDGAGLGLSIVQGVVKSWGGEIEIASRPDQGTTVTITLPAGD